MTEKQQQQAAVGHVARRAASLTDSALVQLLKEAGDDTVNLAVGTPWFPETPPELVEAAVGALRRGHNQYQAPLGEASLRAEVARSFTAPTDPDTQITITAGATEALCVALQTLVDPGDEVVVLEPFYEQFLNAIALSGGIPRFVRLHAPDWHIRPEELRAAFGPRTRAVLLNSPHNPTGMTLGRAELDEIAELCERWNATVICDEVYSTMLYDGTEHLSVADVAALADRGTVVGSLSKSHAVSGWRLGYLRAAPARTWLFRRVHEATTSGTAGPFQLALGEMGLRMDLARVRGRQLEQMRDAVLEMFTRFGLRFEKPRGGCFVFGHIGGISNEDAPEFALRLLREHGILVAPGRPFFADAERARPYVRIAFNRSWEVLKDVEQRLFHPAGPVLRGNP